MIWEVYKDLYYIVDSIYLMNYLYVKLFKLFLCNIYMVFGERAILCQMCGVTLLPHEHKICVFCKNNASPEDRKKSKEEQELWWKREGKNFW